MCIWSLSATWHASNWKNVQKMQWNTHFKRSIIFGRTKGHFITLNLTLQREDSGGRPPVVHPRHFADASYNKSRRAWSCGGPLRFMFVTTHVTVQLWLDTNTTEQPLTVDAAVMINNYNHNCNFPKRCLTEWMQPLVWRQQGHLM